jgi:murein DD-endopeptidase MepM/ murein hydrolase activator NlpD
MSSPYRLRALSLVIAALLAVTLACARQAQSDDPGSWWVPGQDEAPSQPLDPPTPTPFLPSTRLPGAPILTPTPDEPHRLPAMRTEPEEYVVQPGDTLGIISQRYGVSLEDVIQANPDLKNPDLLDVGQVIIVPVPTPQGQGPSFKIIPDSELVYSAGSALFNVESFIKSQNGYLASYREDLDGKQLTGPQVVQRIAQEYSVNPRLLLAVLQYESNWVTRTDLGEGKIDYPMGVRETWRKGLYRQLSWAANTLNRGYYLWRANAAATWVLGDGSVAPISPNINAGTAGVQHMFAVLYGRPDWEQAVGENGVFAVYNSFFGYPFDYAIEPLTPLGLSQPHLLLPFEQGQAWAFTGGPHGGWGDGSAWAALDFAPPTDALGCIVSDDWVTAVADGLILRAEDGAVIQDLDSDGYEQTGWVVLYMHIETRDRVQPGTALKAGDRIGHPSCEGGVSSGTHVHLARRYNGEWIPADQSLPFILDGWVSRGAGKEYDGFLEKGGHEVEAYAGRSAENAISR